MGPDFTAGTRHTEPGEDEAQVKPEGTTEHPIVDGESIFINIPNSSLKKQMATRKFLELFKGDDLAKHYSLYRPGYPQKVYDVIVSYHQESGHGAWDLAVDCGCGTGQGTFPLANYFEKVIGVDVSEDQLAAVSKSDPKVTFRQGVAEDLSFLQPGSVDLITAATAVHWMDRDKFFVEAYRVLKPHGTLAVYSYEYEHFQSDLVENYMQKMFWGPFGVYQNQTPQSKALTEKYQFITMPLMEDCKWLDVTTMEADWTIDQYLDYIQSHCYLHQYKRDHPDHDILRDIKEQLTNLLRSGDQKEEDVRINPRWEIFMVIGRKPV